MTLELENHYPTTESNYRNLYSGLKSERVLIRKEKFSFLMRCCDMKEHNCNHINEPCPKKVPLFRALSNEEILKVAKMANHIPYQKGQMVI